MRKITEQICKAFINGYAQKMSNTETDGQKLWLHGNLIATKRLAGQEVDGLFITNAGWQSMTTKERLNGLPGVSINQKAGQWYLNGKKWDGAWVNVNEFANLK